MAVHDAPPAARLHQSTTNWVGLARRRRATTSYHSPTWKTHGPELATWTWLTPPVPLGHVVRRRKHVAAAGLYVTPTTYPGTSTPGCLSTVMMGHRSVTARASEHVNPKVMPAAWPSPVVGTKGAVAK